MFDQFSTPVNVNALAMEAKTEAHAIEIYAASAMIIMPPSPAEKQYMDSLAGALRLPRGLEQEILRALEEKQSAA